MNTALPFVEFDRPMAPTMSPASLTGLTRASMRPTVVPSPRVTMPWSRFDRTSEPPATQRSATVHPRFEATARHDMKNLIALMRLKLTFLELLHTSSSPLALDALADLHHSIDRLERRCTSFAPVVLAHAR